MENIRDIRDQKGLYYILDEKNSSYDIPLGKRKNIAIVVYVYYQDTSELYLKYMREIPEGIDVFIISSNQEIYQQYESYIQSRRNVTFLLKKNRGRDISALLVASKNIFNNYQYLCFVHDKKEKAEYMSEDVKFWIENMWDNTIKSAAYIENVVELLENNTNLGLLTIPEPMGERMVGSWSNVWGENFSNTKALAEKLGLTCDIDIQNPPITLSTAFWCKTNAMKKLIDVEWNYEDFPDEPLADDGTINHAIERILGYVAQDSGYDTGTIMTTSYAEKYISFLQSGFQQTLICLRNITGISNLTEIKRLEQNSMRITAFFEKYQKVYLYGAGCRGRDCVAFSRILGYRPEGVIVTKRDENVKSIDEIPIVTMEEIEISEDVGIIISVGYKLQPVIMRILKEKGVTNYICYLMIDDSDTGQQ